MSCTDTRFISTNITDFLIRSDQLDAAYQAVCHLNADEVKASHLGVALPEEDVPESESISTRSTLAYPCMDWNYDATCDNLYRILLELGFEVFLNHDLSIEGFFGSSPVVSGDKTMFELVLETLAPFVAFDGMMIQWDCAEDGLVYRMVFADGGYTTSVAEMIWEDIRKG